MAIRSTEIHTHKPQGAQVSNETTFTRSHATTAKFETPLGTVSVCDVRKFDTEWSEHDARHAEIAEVCFNITETPNNWPGQFTINGREYKTRLTVSRGWDGGISVSSSYHGELTDAARRRLVAILEPIVAPLMPRLTEDAMWGQLEGTLRGVARGALRRVPSKLEAELRGHGLTGYSGQGSKKTEAEVTRAYALAVRVITEELAALPELKSLNGYRD